MKKFTKKTKIILASALALAIVGVAAGTTTAYLMDRTDAVVNTFAPGSVETEIVEIVSGATKEPYILNVGKNDCYVRMRVSVSPEKPLMDVVDKINGDWEYEEDGYYYYKGKLAPGETTLNPLFNEVKTGKANSSIEIQLYQEAVQAVVTKPDGTVLSGDDKMMEIWKFYENY